MSDAFIYEHVRTPRGKGKKDGRLHQASPVWLLRTLMKAMEQRLALDTASLPAGLYFAVARADHARVTQRVVLLH